MLNEPAAKKLWDIAQEHERNDQLCCAYWVYKEAAELMPAPSASRASARFDELSKDNEVVAAAETCRTLKWCHAAYACADKLLPLKPNRARRSSRRLSKRAPEDSEVYRAAREHVMEP